MTLKKIFKPSLLGLAALLSACGDKIHIFDGLEGPADISVIAAPSPADPADYKTGETNRLAVYLTDPNSNWLSLTRGLKTIGIPFRVTQNYEDALAHDVVLVYPHITGRVLKPDALAALRRYTKDGGTLIGTNVLGGGLQDVFGFDSIDEGKDKSGLSFLPSPETEGFADKDLDKIKIGSASDIAANPGTNVYQGAKNVLARYETGDAAIISSKFGAGKTYALGIDAGQVLAKGYNRRQVDTALSYANEFQPALDSILIFLENLYRQNEPQAVTLGTVPDGKKLSFILSYDVDFSESLENAITYAQDLSNRDVRGTFFVQTKYVEDFNDKIFLDDRGAELIGQLDSLGVEVASHTVAHSNALWDFPMGSGKEAYPKYAPFVQTAEQTRGATILGELRVSKFLLDSFAQGQSVRSFRPGFLANPHTMPQALAATGYDYSSSTTANVSLTHLPFQLTHDRGFDALTPIFEIPITLEDELGDPLYERLQDGINLARKIAHIEGSFVALIHTDDVDGRLKAQQALIEEVQPYSSLMSIGEFGDWWRARNAVEIDVEETRIGLNLKINAPLPIDGLTLDIPEGFAPADPDVKRAGSRLVLGELSGEHVIVLTAQSGDPR